MEHLCREDSHGKDPAFLQTRSKILRNWTDWKIIRGYMLESNLSDNNIKMIEIIFTVI